jgi:hypothetical protein
MDDVEDNSLLRRGLPVAHTIYGIPQTINTANYVYFQAMKELLAMEGIDGDGRRVSEKLRSQMPDQAQAQAQAQGQGQAQAQAQGSPSRKGKEKEVDLVGVVTGELCVSEERTTLGQRYRLGIPGAQVSKPWGEMGPHFCLLPCPVDLLF